MKYTFLFFLFLTVSFKGISQDVEFVIWITSDSIVEGLCDEKFVLALDEDEPSFPKLLQSEEQIFESIEFLQNDPKLKAKGSFVGMVNCEGKMVYFEMLMEADEALVQEIENYFLEESNWEPGTFLRNPIDAQILGNLKIKKGKLKID